MPHMVLPSGIQELAAKLSVIPDGVFISKLKYLTQMDGAFYGDVIPCAASYDGWHLAQHLSTCGRDAIARYCFREMGGEYMLTLAFRRGVITLEVVPVRKSAIITVTYPGHGCFIDHYIPEQVLTAIEKGLSELVTKLQ